MKIIDHKLFIEFAEMEACDVPRRTILSWNNIKDPTVKRKILIAYDDLKDKYQELVVRRFGDPYTYVHNQAIKQYLKVDIKAKDFFTLYRTDSGQTLSKEKIQQYVSCANWLNLLIEVDNNWSKCKHLLSMSSKTELYEAVLKIFIAEEIKLPHKYQPLLRKVSRYKAEGYAGIISKKLDNTNSKKVKGELNTALLLEMIGHPAQYDDTFISIKYNKFAEVAGHKTITPVTVGNYRKEHLTFIQGSRQGNKVWYNNSGKSTPQERPSAPLLLINSDDNELDLYFQEVKIGKDGKTRHSHYFRPVLIVVTDAFNDYPLGWAVGDSATKALVHAAYLNAANHVRELTGGRYFWHEIKTDRWGIDRQAKNDWSQWFSAQARFTPTLLGNSRGKVIEQSFGKNWGNKLKEMFPKHYSGHNITSKSKVNPEWIELNKKNFPSSDQAASYVAAFMNEMRQLKDKHSGKTRQQMWLDAFETMQENKKRLISDEQHLMLLGYDHINSHTRRMESNTITNKGLTPTINECQYIFEIPKEQYLNTLGMKVNIKYDPYDMNRVLAVSQDEKIRMVCESFEKMPMAHADWDERTEQRLNEIMREKGHHQKVIRASKEERQAILNRYRMNAESVLGAGVLKKELKHAATKLIEGNYEDAEELSDEIEHIDVRRLM
jgi:hypothetical protein